MWLFYLTVFLLQTSELKPLSCCNCCTSCISRLLVACPIHAFHLIKCSSTVNYRLWSSSLSLQHPPTGSSGSKSTCLCSDQNLSMPAEGFHGSDSNEADWFRNLIFWLQTNASRVIDSLQKTLNLLRNGS